MRIPFNLIKIPQGAYNSPINFKYKCKPMAKRQTIKGLLKVINDQKNSHDLIQKKLLNELAEANNKLISLSSCRPKNAEELKQDLYASERERLREVDINNYFIKLIKNMR